jgi:hypothetical protein
MIEPEGGFGYHDHNQEVMERTIREFGLWISSRKSNQRDWEQLLLDLRPVPGR